MVEGTFGAALAAASSSSTSVSVPASLREGSWMKSCPRRLRSMILVPPREDTRESLEQLLALARCEDAEHLAILRDRAPRDLDAVVLRENLHDRLIGERVLLVLGVDDLLDRLLHALGGDVLLGDATDGRVEEVLQLEETL